MSHGQPTLCVQMHCKSLDTWTQEANSHYYYYYMDFVYDTNVRKKEHFEYFVKKTQF